jgi:thiol:disulfide interchange protein DsbG
VQKQKFTILILIVTILVLLLYVFSITTISSAKPTNKSAQIVQEAFPQYKIIKNFGREINLQGYILEDKNDPKKRTVTFTNDNGSVIVNGELLAWDRNENKLTNLNQIYANYFITDDKANNLYLDIVKYSSYIQQSGNDALHKFYAVIDSSCSYCNYLFDASQPAIKKSLLAVIWIPLGALRNSPPIVSSIFNSNDPLKLFSDYHDRHNYDKTNIQENDRATNNLKLLKNILGFPTIVYKNSEGALKISGGNKLPLVDTPIAKKENIKKINKFLLSTFDKF